MGRVGRRSSGVGELRTGVNGGGVRAAGGAVPESPPLCNVNGGRLVWHARTGGTARGRAGPDGGALRAQVRPGGRGVAGAVGAPCARVLAEGSPECGVGSGAVASGAALGLVRRAAAAAERARAREGERGRAGRGTARAAVGRGRGPYGVRMAEQEGQRG